jgi:hypothetical protein
LYVLEISDAIIQFGFTRFKMMMPEGYTVAVTTIDQPRFIIVTAAGVLNTRIE